MILNYGSYLRRVLTTRYGSSDDDWPPSAKNVVPLFSAIIDVVDLDQAVELFEAGIRACRRETSAPTGGRRDWAGYLSLELPEQKSPPFAEMAAWGTFLTIQSIVQQDAAADFETYVEAALEACKRDTDRPRREPVTAAAMQP
ncbi:MULTISPECIES: hypothetical protein [unclassified Streptomyces]|uniref:hypothetical protein n=1 Tax=unclassified Streptomyces TaxID=2593676 RepID=UPI002E3227B9|nr:MULTISPECIES: hypothetical protein [unclassified Streptomyces]WUC69162.1 hypothetical protein OG861_33505 [Streptomyces sp. NBC_00539]